MYLSTLLESYKGKAKICIRDRNDNELCTAPITSDVFYHYDKIVIEWLTFGEVIVVKVEYSITE